MDHRSGVSSKLAKRWYCKRKRKPHTQSCVDLDPIPSSLHKGENTLYKHSDKRSDVSLSVDHSMTHEDTFDVITRNLSIDNSIASTSIPVTVPVTLPSQNMIPAYTMKQPLPPLTEELPIPTPPATVPMAEWTYVVRELRLWKYEVNIKSTNDIQVTSNKGSYTFAPLSQSHSNSMEAILVAVYHNTITGQYVTECFFKAHNGNDRRIEFVRNDSLGWGAVLNVYFFERIPQTRCAHFNLCTRIQ